MYRDETECLRARVKELETELAAERAAKSPRNVHLIVFSVISSLLGLAWLAAQVAGEDHPFLATLAMSSLCVVVTGWMNEFGRSK